MSGFAKHPVAHLRKVAMAYKKELGVSAVGKMTKPELVMLLDKYLSLDEDHKITVKGKSSGSKDLEDILEGKKMEEGKGKEMKQVEKMVKVMKKKTTY